MRNSEPARSNASSTSSVRSRVKPDCPDVVAIFYVDVPKNSSDLIFVKNGKDYEELKNINEEDIHTIQPIEGELIIHSPNLWHAVGMHNNDLPRNVFVFDIDYV